MVRETDKRRENSKENEKLKGKRLKPDRQAERLRVKCGSKDIKRQEDIMRHTGHKWDYNSHRHTHTKSNQKGRKVG